MAYAAPLPLNASTASVANTGLAADTRALDSLRGAASRDPRAAVREAARQFESLFTHELLKSMRAATPVSGLSDNEGTKLGTELLDQQLSTKLAGLPGGLADSIARQLERQMGLAKGPEAAGGVNGVNGPNSLKGLNGLNGLTPNKPGAGPNPVDIRPKLKPDLAASAVRPQSFVAEHQNAAQQTEAATGIPATFMIAQAGLETGWGKHQIKMADGTPSNNLFGIKAGADWKGPVAEVTTTEYINGVARKVKATFRAYASAAESFADYAKLMTQSPRYQRVMASVQGGSSGGASPQQFAQSLQRAGYATDPQYADKLSRVINTTLRLQRSLA
jgi:peptidoglycan hydrolase FlgJ